MNRDGKYESMEEIADNLICYLGKERFREFALFDDIRDTGNVLARRPVWRADLKLDVRTVPRADAAKYGRVLAWSLPEVLDIPWGHLMAIEEGFEPVTAVLMNSPREFSYLYEITGSWYREALRARLGIYAENRVIFIGRGFDYDDELGPEGSGDPRFDVSVYRLTPEEFFRKASSITPDEWREICEIFTDLSGHEAAELVCEELD